MSSQGPVSEQRTLPESLKQAGLSQLAELHRHLNTSQSTILGNLLRKSPELHSELISVFAVSEYVAQRARVDSAWFLRFLENRLFEQPLNDEVIKDEIARTQEADQSLSWTELLPPLKKSLRQVRHRCMVRVFWRNAVGRNGLQDTVTAVSLLADRLIQRALDQLYRAACEKEGAPTGKHSGRPQQLVVLALGKLGARELNLSSDVDLIFSYAEDGLTQKTAKPNQAFFLRLCQKLVAALDEPDADGFAFRVDMRLRPYGESGALVLNFNAMELYYSQQGRDWERYAWIKARVCAGDTASGQELLDLMQPFVYRKYLDFGAIQSLRDMKARVEQERSTEQLKYDLKLGRGGIRDVEFIAQVFQMIFGGREPMLRNSSLLQVLSLLVRLQHLDPEAGAQLTQAYIFLRNSEHAIQSIRDEQTQRLPEHLLDQERLAWMLRCSNYADYSDALSRHCHWVSQHFDALIALPEESSAEDHWRDLWLQENAQVLAQAFARGVTPGQEEDPHALRAAQAELETQLNELIVVRHRSWVGKESRERLDAVIPLLFEQASGMQHPLRVMNRLLRIVQAVVRRSAYLTLLMENPHALKELMVLCQTSAYITEELIRYPLLLDELLDPRLLYAPRFRNGSREDLRRELSQELNQVLGRVDTEELETAMEVLRDFKQQQVFRIAVWEVKGTLPLMRVSDHLTNLAEVILQAALKLAWDITASHYKRDVESDNEVPIVVVGYGKLGGIELGPGSDLDLVFIHALTGESFGGEGARLVHRLVRRLLHILSTRTRTGVLYDVDTRLRPSGRSGTMATSLDAFHRYQRDQAWVFEHQALVRARPVAGNGELADRFSKLRREILSQPRDIPELRQAVIKMRQRIEKSAGSSGDLKKPAGGIVDIEFMVQYLVLAWAHRYPELCDYTDNIRILETAAALNLISSQDKACLIDAYLDLRAELHRNVLDRVDTVRAARVLERHADAVRDCWQRMMGAMEVG